MPACPYCHCEVPKGEYLAHVRRHERLQPDGQQTDYATLPPDQRFQGRLEDVPQVYYHSVCEAQTGVSDDIVRTYLANPFFYGSRTYCSGCESHVHHRELVWVETGENVADYHARLRSRFGLFARERWHEYQLFLCGAAAGGVVLGVLGAAVGAMLGSAAVGFLVGGFAGATTGLGLIYKLRHL